MVFSSPIFLYGFLPLVLAVYYLLPRRERNGWLVAASYLFYGWGNPFYVFLLVFSTGLDFCCALGLAGSESRGRRRALLCCSIVGNLGVLAFFKYSGFFARAFVFHFRKTLLENPTELNGPAGGSRRSGTPD